MMMLDKMSSLEIVTLMGNLLVKAKEKALDEFAGTDLADSLIEIYDELAGCLGEAKALLEEGKNNKTDVSELGPSVPSEGE